MTSNERFPKGALTHHPRNRAVVSFLRQARALSEGDAASAEAYGRCHTSESCCHRPRSRQGTEQNVPSPPAACANLPPAALPQIWVHPAPIFSFAKEKQKLEVKNYGNLSFGSKGYQQRRRPLCCCCRSLYELQRDL